MSDRVFSSFLEHTFGEAKALAAGSDVLTIIPVLPWPPATYCCVFAVRYLRRPPSGIVEVAPGPVEVGLHFPQDYLRSSDPRLGLKVAAMLTEDFFHPNVRDSAICLGSAFAPGTPIRWLLWELHEVVAYRNVGLDERNALNPEACRLLRQRPEILAGLGPFRPLRRRARPVQVTVTRR